MLPQNTKRDDGNVVFPAPGEDLLHVRHRRGKDDRQGWSHLRVVLVATSLTRLGTIEGPGALPSTMSRGLRTLCLGPFDPLHV